MEGTCFDAPWGTHLKVISFLVTALLLGIFAGMAVFGDVRTPLQTALYLVVPPAVLAPALLLTVRGYRITGEGISVKRLLWNTDIALGVLRRVEHDPKAMTGAIRTWGNGGLFSFSGRFRSGRLGSFRAYVTYHRNCVLIESVSGILVVSPGNPGLFVEMLENGIRER
ncbi:MAG: hypothetical protein AVO35_02355 [Candidatus Aegiribacteria sp. MLS_C]|nr:MAG: hypothetical protein AVO35_02355 [Candidatus Aegiribacteria sp. MLS_C]